MQLDIFTTMEEPKTITIYKSLITGVLIRIVKQRDTGVDTFIECDEKGEPTLKKRLWSIGKKPENQHYLVKRPYEGKLTVWLP